MTNKLLPLLLVFIAPCAWAAQPVIINLSAGITLDDNITRASLNEDIERDSIINLEASADYQIPANAHSFFTLNGHLGINEYQDIDGLSNTIIGIEGSYNIQFSNNFTAPWYLLSLTYDQLDYDSTFRDASLFSTEAGFGKRLTDRVSLRTGIVWESIDADENTFDVDNRHIYLNFDYKLGHHNTLYITLGYTDGDVTSVTGDTTTASTKASTDIRKISPSDAIRYSHHLPGEIPVNLIRDDAFIKLSPNRFVYQLDATTWSLTVGDNVDITHNQSIDAAILFYTSDTYADDYDGMIAQFSYLYRF